MQPDPNRGPALVVATVASFLTPFMGSAANIALPAIAADLHLGALSLSWVASSFLLAAAMVLVPFGRLADLHGRRRVFVGGVAVYVVSSLAAAAAVSGAMLIAARAAQGFGSAMMFGTGTAILTSVFPAEERGKVLGINMAAVYVGLSSGPFVGGALTQQAGWRSLFLVNAGLGLVALALATVWLRGEWAEARGERFDWPGSLLYAAALAMLMLGLTHLPGRAGWALLAAGAAGLAGFIRVELLTTSPVLRLDLFRRTAFGFSNLAALIHYSATYALGFLLSLYLQYVRGMTPLAAGFVLVAQPVVMAAVAPLAGRLSDRVEPRTVASLGMLLTSLGLGSFAWLGAETSLRAVVLGLALLGFGFALFSSPNANAVMSAVERRHYGIAAGTLGTMRLTGQMLSMGVATLILAVHVGAAPLGAANGPQLLQSARVAFVLFAVLCFGGIFASLARGRLRAADA